MNQTTIELQILRSCDHVRGHVEMVGDLSPWQPDFVCRDCGFFLNFEQMRMLSEHDND